MACRRSWRAERRSEPPDVALMTLRPRSRVGDALIDPLRSRRPCRSFHPRCSEPTSSPRFNSSKPHSEPHESEHSSPRERRWLVHARVSVGRAATWRPTELAPPCACYRQRCGGRMTRLGHLERERRRRDPRGREEWPPSPRPHRWNLRRWSAAIVGHGRAARRGLRQSARGVVTERVWGGWKAAPSGSHPSRTRLLNAVQPVGHSLRHPGICEPSRGCEPLEVGVKGEQLPRPHCPSR